MSARASTRAPTGPAPWPRAPLPASFSKASISAAAARCPCLWCGRRRSRPRSAGASRQNRDRADLDERLGRGHLADLDHGGGGRRRAEIFAAHFVDRVEVLHVADIDIDAADIVHGAAGLFDGGLQILAHLAR